MQTRLFRAVPGWLAVCALIAAATPLAVRAATGTNLAVDLKDPTSDSNLSSMVITSNQATVKAGEVSFTATNRSTALVHEMIVVKLDKAGQVLPYDAAQDKLDEGNIRHLGEVSELEPGRSGTLRLKLAPGIYALLCNQPGHYHAGMATTITVTE